MKRRDKIEEILHAYVHDSIMYITPCIDQDSIEEIATEVSEIEHERVIDLLKRLSFSNQISQECYLKHIANEIRITEGKLQTK